MEYRSFGATTFSITTLTIKTFSITTLTIKTFSILGLVATMSINDIQHNVFSVIMLSVVELNIMNVSKARAFLSGALNIGKAPCLIHKQQIRLFGFFGKNTLAYLQFLISGESVEHQSQT